MQEENINMNCVRKCSVPIVEIKIPYIVESVVEMIPIVEIAQKRKIVRKQIDSVLTGLRFYVKARAVKTVEETVETVEDTVEIAEEIPEAIEILIPTRKFTRGTVCYI
jgi:hypothetical protein